MLIDTTEKFERIIPSLLSCSNPCVDTETTGLDYFGAGGEDRDKVIGISIDTVDEAYYMPFRHLNGCNLPMSCYEWLSGYLSNSGRTYIGFNYGFDLHMLHSDGVPITDRFEDAMLAMHLINENEPSFRLKEICDRYNIGDGSLQESILEDKVYDRCVELGMECSRSSRSKNNVKSMMYVLNPEDVEPYACDDVRLTRSLMDLLRDALRNTGMEELFRQINYYEYIIVTMEEAGMHLDRSLVGQYREEAIGKKSESLEHLQSMAGFSINPNSSKQVCAWLGVESSASEKLQDLIDAGGEDSDKATAVQEARGWSSVDSRYYTPYVSLMGADDCIHCNLNLTGTYTGRLSCSHPNLQAVARSTDVFKVKDVFTARDGFTMVQADYKQAEMRLVTHYTKDPVMKKLIESNADLHTATAERLGIPRNAAKRINFSVIYGIGYKHLAENLRVDQRTAKGYLDSYHALYPGFKKLMRQCEDFAREYGYIEMWTGRVRHFNVPQADPHKAMSNLIQGGVAEIGRVAISRLYPAIQDLGGKMLMQVHDSVIFEIPDSNVKIALPTIKHIMEDFPFEPRVGVDIEYGKSWGSFASWEPEGVV